MTSLMAGITACRVETPRLTQNLLETGRTDGVPVLFVHGNVSSSLFWQPTMLALPAPYQPLAVDLRGFGDTDPVPVNATRGVRDWSDDVAALLDALGLDRVHLVGWSLGGGALAPTHLRLDALSTVDPKPPVLWIRGTADVIVSDTSLYDLANLGALGAIPGWPGADAYPPQPMVGQTRAVLDAYAANGGRYREVALEGSGHGPHLDRPEEFRAALTEHLAGA